MAKKSTQWQLRMEAAARGQKRFQGPPCKNCGSTERYVSSGRCTTCTALEARARQAGLKRAIRRGRAA